MRHQIGDLVKVSKKSDYYNSYKDKVGRIEHFDGYPDFNPICIIFEDIDQFSGDIGERYFKENDLRLVRRE